MKATKTTAGNLALAASLLLTASVTTDLVAQTMPGQAEVRAIKGSAVYSTASQPAVPLRVGTVLPAGSTIKTALASSVDLFLGNSAGVLRVTENTTLALDKMAITDTGADTVVEVQLNLPEGTILGNVNKLSAASKYEIKLPNGVAGIRGTRFRISSTAFIVLLNGTLIFVHAPPGGPLTPHTLNAPPAMYFSPLQGVVAAPTDLIREVENQSSDRPNQPSPVSAQTRPPAKKRPLDNPVDAPGDSKTQDAVPPFKGAEVGDDGKLNEELSEKLDLPEGDVLSPFVPAVPPVR